MESDISLDHLKAFYQHLFPWQQLYFWLSYNQKSFEQREFSFTLASDAYLRFQSFDNSQDLKQQVIKLNPVKLDIGAVYSTQPKNRKSVHAGSFKPIERELVIDIDMTDYDDIRTCCEKAQVCIKCWRFMTIAIKILDRALRDDFGFNHLLWVFSGRRGIHCWICDHRARQLSSEIRRSIVGYLEVIKGGEQQANKVKIQSTKLHPSLAIAYDYLEKQFQIVLKEQDFLGTLERCHKILALIPDEEIKESCLKEWNSSQSSQERWQFLVNQTKKQSIIRDIIFQYTYPRLDDKVTTGLNHLLKSPFCIHPKTGKVCVPIDPLTCESFDPMQVPCLSDLMDQINGDNGTALDPYLEYFKGFLKGLLAENKQFVSKDEYEF